MPVIYTSGDTLVVTPVLSITEYVHMQNPTPSANASVLREGVGVVVEEEGNGAERRGREYMDDEGLEGREEEPMEGVCREEEVDGDEGSGEGSRSEAPEACSSSGPSLISNSFVCESKQSNTQKQTHKQMRTK